MIVDHQAHWYPPAALDLLVGREGYPRIERAAGAYLYAPAPGVAIPIERELLDLDALLARADAAGVDALVLSANLLAEVLDFPAQEAAELLRQANAIFAAAQREHPDRVVGLAMLPLQDPEAAVELLEEAHADGLSGVLMLPTIAGAPLAGEATLPVFQRMAQLGMPLLLHPEGRTRTRLAGASRRGEIAISWMAYTALAALELIDSGTLDACPDLVVLHPHLGGVLPWLRRRVDDVMRPEGQPPLADYLRTRFYTDSVNGTPGALRIALELYGPERVLFASDVPHGSFEAARAFVEDEGARAIYDNRLPGLRVPARAGA